MGLPACKRYPGARAPCALGSRLLATNPVVSEEGCAPGAPGQV